MLIYCQEILFGLKTQYNGLGLKCDSSKLFPCRGAFHLKFVEIITFHFLFNTWKMRTHPKSQKLIFYYNKNVMYISVRVALWNNPNTLKVVTTRHGRYTFTAVPTIDWPLHTIFWGRNVFSKCLFLQRQARVLISKPSSWYHDL